MDASEFDRFAEEYEALHRANDESPARSGVFQLQDSWFREISGAPAAVHS